jgi:hypothetical protein
MHILLIEWKIIPGKEDEFKDYWKTKVPVQDRTQLVGEFLSSVNAKTEEFPWVTWNSNKDSSFSHFINVALWANVGAFHRQIGKYFDPAKGKLDFEFELRRRSLLSPECWRMGDWNLPKHDSGGVL